ncbi:hypothetical protein AAE478_008067 [Parahypoxylon ruwenzoriense]
MELIEIASLHQAVTDVGDANNSRYEWLPSGMTGELSNLTERGGSQVCIAFIYSGLVLLMQHAGSRRQRFSTKLIAFFIAGDVLFNGMAIAIITVLARAGLPTDCHGLTRDDMEIGDAPDDPPDGYSTIRFGDKERDRKGLLDKYCSLERGFYFIEAALVFTYMVTVTLGVLRIFERRWSNNGRTDQRFASADNAHRLDRLNTKVHSPDPGRDSETAVPSTEGLTPASRPSPALRIQQDVPPNDPHRDYTFHGPLHPQPLPVSPVSIVASPISQVSPLSPHASFAPSVALGTSIGGLMIEHASDPAAEAAMITDGYRHQLQPGTPSLPPYTPGQSRGQFMDGHGNESNEMRLSDYVKGETRAQNMKDSGRGI